MSDPLLVLKLERVTLVSLKLVKELILLSLFLFSTVLYSVTSKQVDFLTVINCVLLGSCLAMLTMSVCGVWERMNWIFQPAPKPDSEEEAA